MNETQVIDMLRDAVPGDPTPVDPYGRLMRRVQRDHHRRRTALVGALAFAVLLTGSGVALTRGPIKANGDLLTIALSATEGTSARVSFATEMEFVDPRSAQRQKVVSTASGVLDFTRLVGELTSVTDARGPLGRSTRTRIRMIGDVQYQEYPPGELPDGKRWVRSPVESDPNTPANLRFDLETMLSGFPFLKHEPTHVGSDSQRGVPTERYRVEGDFPTPSGAPAGYNVDLDVICDIWIDAQGLVRRMELRVEGATAAGSERQEIVQLMTMEFWDFGIEVDVDAPPESQVIDEDEYEEQRRDEFVDDFESDADGRNKRLEDCFEEKVKGSSRAEFETAIQECYREAGYPSPEFEDGASSNDSTTVVVDEGSGGG